MGNGIDAVEKMSDVLSDALSYQRPIVKAFCAWARSQELDDGQFLSTLASINGLTVGVLARDAATLQTGLQLAMTQISTVAAITHAAKLQMDASADKAPR